MGAGLSERGTGGSPCRRQDPPRLLGARPKLPLDFDDWAPTPLVWKGRLILAFKRRLVAVGEAEGAR